MREETFKTVAAAAVLLLFAAVALVQLGPGEPSSVEITSPSTAGAALTSPPSLSPLATPSTPEPFQYRIGLLSAVTTDNYWKYLGEDPTVWNTYVLGPTKPALYGIDPASQGLKEELIIAADGPQLSGDRWSVTLSLATTMVWSDGKPITADDVEFTFETVRRLHLGGGWAEAYSPAVGAVTALSDTEVRVDFEKEPTLEVWPYGVGLAPIMPSHAWADLVKGVENAAGLYALPGDVDVSAQARDSDRSVEVIYRVFKNETAAVEALAEAEIDTILSPTGLSLSSVERLNEVEGVSIAGSPANAVRYLGFNLGREPMSEPAFREAVALLLDREQVVSELAPGGDPAYTVLTPSNAAWYDSQAASAIRDPFSRTLETKLSSALTGLQNAGYEWSEIPATRDGDVAPGSGLMIDGRPPAPLTILTAGDEYDPAQPEYAAEIELVLEWLGFDVRPVVTDFNSVVDLAFTANGGDPRPYDMYLLGWTLGNPALPDYHEPLFSRDGSVNSTGYSNEAFESALLRYQQATGVDEARSALWELESILATDLPYLVLYHPEITEAYRSDRLSYGFGGVLSGVQGRLGGVADLIPKS